MNIALPRRDSVTSVTGAGRLVTFRGLKDLEAGGLCEGQNGGGGAGPSPMMISFSQTCTDSHEDK